MGLMIKTLDNDQPVGRSWEAFLTECELRETADGVTLYSYVNCHYLLFPNQYLVQNFGFNGMALLNRVRNLGWQFVWNEIELNYNFVRKMLYDTQ